MALRTVRLQDRPRRLVALKRGLMRVVSSVRIWAKPAGHYGCDNLETIPSISSELTDDRITRLVHMIVLRKLIEADLVEFDDELDDDMEPDDADLIETEEWLFDDSDDRCPHRGRRLTYCRREPETE